MKEIVIPLVIVAILFASVTTVIVAYLRLLGRRAESAALAQYRGIAEQSVANQQALQARLDELTTRTAAVETLLRSIDT